MTKEINYDKLISDGNSFTFPICNNCKFNRGDGTCQAFPKGILDEILNGENDHSKPLPGQLNSVTFERISNE